MAWFLMARLLFTGAVAYTAFLLRPVGPDALLNVLFGLALAGVAVLFEWMLRDLALTSLLGALVGGAIGLGIAKGIGAALFWADPNDERVAFFHGFLLLVLPYIGLVIGGRRGEWLEPSRLLSLFRATGPQRRYRILDTSVIIDGRIADLCDTGFMDGTLVIPQFVLKELQLVADSAASTKRNRRCRVRLEATKPRPRRPRYPAENSDDVGRRSHHLRRRLSRGPGGRPEADRTGSFTSGKDRHQRLQPEQGGAAPRCRGPEHQRARQ